jgi:ABC-type branched-subunit amino acid transport system substrate-binding protein
MQRLLTIVLILLILVPIIVAQDTACVPATGEAIVVGAIFPQDVLLVSDTTAYYQGADAMRQTINACGGIENRPIEWIFETASSFDSGQAAFERLSNRQAVPLIVGSGFDAVHDALVEAVDEAGIVLWEVSENLEADSEWVYYALPQDRTIGRETARFVIEAAAGLLSEPLQIALIHEDRPRAQRIAQGFRNQFEGGIVIDESYSNSLNNAESLAVAMRELDVNVVVIVAFHNDADRLWLAMRQADANVGAWLHIGGADYQNGLCNRLANTDSLLLVGTSSLINDAFPQAVNPAILAAYLQTYRDLYGTAPNFQANLSASGMYVLLTEILPQTNGDYSAEAIRSVLETTDMSHMGMVGEAAAVVAQQNQNGAFCTVSPSGLSTCGESLQSFPTWRERALRMQQRYC